MNYLQDQVPFARREEVQKRKSSVSGSSISLDRSRSKRLVLVEENMDIADIDAVRKTGILSLFIRGLGPNFETDNDNLYRRDKNSRFGITGGFGSYGFTSRSTISLPLPLARRHFVYLVSFMVLLLGFVVAFERTLSAYIVVNPEVDNDFLVREELSSILMNFIEEETGSVANELVDNVPVTKIAESRSSLKNDQSYLYEEDTDYLAASKKTLSDDIQKHAGAAATSSSHEYSSQAYSTHAGMVQFIAGLVAVYLPEISDAGGIAREVVAASIREDIDPLYVAAVISVESRFSVSAKSKVGAIGLMQLMPETGKDLIEKIMGKKVNLPLSEPKINILLGIYYLKYLEKKYRGNRRLALAAYNWGPANVDKALKGELKIPGSVAKYSQTVLTRTSRWNKHHFLATRNAALLTTGHIVG
ncbi:MAG TPA: lytic transglycosylase domain-containing protein [Oligoflexia bacterium]|nr:lytic transglycosylase domain-containing protein [Oligoflexia bacterium]HMP49874.1 lytic transglycosylase domain-containing protein [Oligoflexia bacterium]